MAFLTRRADARGAGGPGSTTIPYPDVARGSALSRSCSTRVAGSLVAVSVMLVPLLSGCGGASGEIVAVSLGSVTSSVSSTGTLRFVDRISVGFPEGGKISAIKVKVGDRVVPGQPLAEVDNLEQRVSVRKAQATVKIEEARLAKLVNGNQLETASDETDGSATQLGTQKRISEETIEAEKAKIRQIERQLEFDRKQLRRLQEQLEEDRECIGQGDDDDSDNAVTDVTELDDDDDGDTSDDCIDRINAREDAIEAARGSIIDTKGELNAARNSLDVTRQSQELAVESARKSRVASENAEDLRRIERPYDVEVQRQILDQARADLELSQRNLDKTFKPSSYNGVVDGINGRVGQVMKASSGAPVPGAAADAPAGDQLISLKDVNAHQVVVPFSEADGAKITRDRSVEVSFEQLPGVVIPARVAAIEPPVPGRSAGYLVTVVLERPDERLTDGLAARVAVATGKIDNAMVVPASAVRVNGRTGTVTQLAPDGAERETSVELGMIGDRTIQILSGLSTNDQVRAVHSG